MQPSMNRPGTLVYEYISKLDIINLKLKAKFVSPWFRFSLWM